jgi:signal transduction histidine kinase
MMALMGEATRGSEKRGGETPGSTIARAWEALVSPSPRLEDVADRLRARLLAGLLAVMVLAGFLSGLVQLALVPGFLPTFLIMSLALGVLGLGYLASRTASYRIGGAIAALAPLGACLAVVAQNPDDRVWYAFMGLSVLLASVFLSLRATATVAALALAGIVAMAAVLPELRVPERLVPPLMFHLVFSPLMLLAARHRDRLEGQRRQALVESQAAVAEAQRLETVGRLAGGVAHDFGNLLMVIGANVQLIRARPGTPCPELDEVQVAAERSQGLVRQLLTFARRQPSHPRLLAPAEVVGGMEGILRRLAGSGVRLSVERDGAAGRVQIDPSQLEQVVLNLVVNARNAMPAGGTVQVVLRDADVAPASLEAREGVAPGAYVSVAVSDTGTGMTEEVRRRIFEPFFTTREGGQGGFGLAIVHGVVTQAGGCVTVRTAPGRGSTFTVFLPRARDAGPGTAS